MAEHASGSPPEPRRFGGSWGTGWMVGAIVGATILAYAGTFGVPFLLDDRFAITDNASIRSPELLAQAFAPPPESPTAGRPFLNLTFALNYAIGGLAPASYHAVNLGIHLLASLTLFGVIRRTFLTPLLKPRGDPSAAWLAAGCALLWAVHPLQTQSVTYISQRAESLMGLFYLLTLYCFIRGAEGRARLWHPLAVAACALGALTKEVIVTAPLMVWLYDRTFIAGTFRSALQRRGIFYTALAATWLVIGWVVSDLQPRGVGFGHRISSFDYALTQSKAVLIYLKLCLWPSPLIFDRGSPVITSLAEALPCVVTLVGLLAVAIGALVRRSAIGFPLAWFFVVLAPASSIVPVVGATIAENRVYLSLAAVVVLVVFGLKSWLGPRLTGALCTFLALAAVAATIVRNRTYSSAIGIWTETVTQVPNNYRAHNNLAILLAELPDRQREALGHYEEAIRLKPDYAEAHNNLAALLASVPGREAEAVAHYTEAIRLEPSFAAAHNNLANLLCALPGRQNEGLAQFEAALRINPNYAEAHYNLANVLAALPQRQTDAMTHYTAALRSNPDLAEAHNNLGNLLRAWPNRQEEAQSRYVAALRINPSYAEAHYNLAGMLAESPNRLSEALVHYAEAVRLLPNNALAHFSYAQALEKQPAEKSAAAEHYQRALHLDPSLSAARAALERLRP